MTEIEKRIKETTDFIDQWKNPDSISSWDDISDEEVEKFIEFIYYLTDRIIPLSYEGDSPIDIKMIDRRKYEKDHYFPIPYGYKAKTEEEKLERLSDIASNVDLANGALSLTLKLMKYRNSKNKD